MAVLTVPDSPRDPQLPVSLHTPAATSRCVDLQHHLTSQAPSELPAQPRVYTESEFNQVSATTASVAYDALLLPLPPCHNVVDSRRRASSSVSTVVEAYDSQTQERHSSIGSDAIALAAAVSVEPSAPSEENLLAISPPIQPGKEMTTTTPKPSALREKTVTLYRLIKEKDVDRIKNLIEESGIDLNTPFTLNYTTLSAPHSLFFCAITSQSLPIVEHFFTAGAKINISQSSYEYSPIEAAVYHSSFPIIRFLLEQGVDVSYLDKKALQNLIYYCFEQAVIPPEKMLQTRYPEGERPEEYTSNDVAVEWLYVIEELLSSLDVNFSTIPSTLFSLHRFLATRNIPALRFALERGCPIDQQGELGQSLLQTALQEVAEKESQYRTLQARYAEQEKQYFETEDLYNKEIYEQKSRICPFSQSRRETLEIAVNTASAALEKTRSDLQCSKAAITFLVDDLIPFLFIYCPNLNHQDNLQKTPLIDLLFCSEDTIRKLLPNFLTNNTDLNIPDATGNTALSYSIQNNCCYDIVCSLLEAGADPNCIDQMGNTPLFTAIEKKRAASLLAQLVAARVNTNAQDPNGETALMKAMQEGYEREAIGLLAQNSDLNQRDREGKTALFRAIEMHCSDEIVAELLNRGANPNIADFNSNTALGAAIKRGCHSNLLNLLLAKGANPYKVDNYGNTALLLFMLIVFDKSNGLYTFSDDYQTVATETGIISVGQFRREYVKPFLDVGINPGRLNRSGVSCHTLAAKSRRIKMLFKENSCIIS